MVIVAVNASPLWASMIIPARKALVPYSGSGSGSGAIRRSSHSLAVVATEQGEHIRNKTGCWSSYFIQILSSCPLKRLQHSFKVDSSLACFRCQFSQNITPKGGQGFLMSPPCLESRGFQFYPTFMSSFVLSVLSFSAFGPFSRLLFP